MPTAQPETAPSRPIARRLGFRLAVALSLSAMAVLAAALVWNLRLQRRHLTLLIERRAAEMVDVLRATTRQSMLENDAAELQRQLERFSSAASVRRARVFDKLGEIRHSSDPGETGHLVDLSAEQCVSCHAAGKPLTHLDVPQRSRTFRTPEGERVLGVILPIRNELSCTTAACHAHPAERTILGVLDVQLSLASVDESLAASERQLFAGLVGTVLALLALTWLLVWRYVLRPVGALTSAAPRLAAGDFSARVPDRSRDELGELGRAWNHMAVRLGAAHAELNEWGRRLEQRVDEKTRELADAHAHMLLVEKMASLGKLAAIVAHELNNPLAGIATYARLLRRRQAEAGGGDGAVTTPDGAADTERILKLVEEEAMRCGNIVRNLLLFSRTPGARIADEDLSPIVERVALLVRHQFELQEVELVRELAPGLPKLPCDAAQIQQMLLALTMNALEATPAGGKVTIAADTAEGRLRLRVADTGHGIAPEHLPHVFEPFYTTKESGAGVGLGLAVVYGIVERHGGQIDVVSPPGAGTTFTAVLPLSRGAAKGEAEGQG